MEKRERERINCKVWSGAFLEYLAPGQINSLHPLPKVGVGRGGLPSEARQNRRASQSHPNFGNLAI